MDSSENLIIENVTLINGLGTEPEKNQAILIQNGFIKAVGKKSDIYIPSTVKRIDAKGKTILPGLIDSHLHLQGFKTSNILHESLVTPFGVKLIRSVIDVQNLLEAGFTTVKDCGGEEPLSIGINIRNAIQEGTIIGPRVLSSGWLLSITGGHSDFHYFPPSWAKEINPCICDGVPECIKASRFALREGADFIKVCATGGVMSEKTIPDQIQFTMEELKAIVKIAENAGTFVTAHAQGTKGMNQAIEAGIRTIDHANSPDQDTIEMGLKKNIIFVPTLAVAHSFMKPEIAQNMPHWMNIKTQTEWVKVLKGITKLKDAGCQFAVGTDFLSFEPMKHGKNAIELELLTKYCGFTPMEVIKAATFGGAKACGLENTLGTIEKDKIADLIILDGDPLRDITILQDTARIKIVIKDGKIVKNRGFSVN
jgi:imidazolonepropionase-like amidohydrolase